MNKKPNFKNMTRKEAVQLLGSIGVSIDPCNMSDVSNDSIYWLPYEELINTVKQEYEEFSTKETEKAWRKDGRHDGMVKLYDFEILYETAARKNLSFPCSAMNKEHAINQLMAYEYDNPTLKINSVNYLFSYNLFPEIYKNL